MTAHRAINHGYNIRKYNKTGHMSLLLNFYHFRVFFGSDGSFEDDSTSLIHVH